MRLNDMSPVFASMETRASDHHQAIYFKLSQYASSNHSDLANPFHPLSSRSWLELFVERSINESNSLLFNSFFVRLGIVNRMFDTTHERRYQTETKADPLDAEHREKSKIEEHRQRSRSEGRGDLIEDRRENDRAKHDLREPEDLMTIMLFDGWEHHPYEYVQTTATGVAAQTNEVKKQKDDSPPKPSP